MGYQWYPGHMTKAKRMMQEDIRLTDIVIEIVDARVPMSSRNPDIDSMAGGRGRIIIMNKADLADPAVSSEWIRYYKNSGINAVLLDSRCRKDMQSVSKAVTEASAAKIARDKRRGIKNSTVRIFVAGIPNVGKSTFINSFTGKSGAKTGNKPGVTRGDQWIHMNGGRDILDTPGILWPKFEDETVGLHLAWVGTMNDEILDMSDMALQLIDFMMDRYKDILFSRYDIINDGLPQDILGMIAENRKCLKQGGDPDLDKAAQLLLGEFRSGRIGRISIERPQET